MAVVKNLMVRAGADFSGLRKEMQKTKNDVANFKQGIHSSLKVLGTALATLGIGTAIKDATKSAMDVEAAMQQVNRTMGTNAAAFVEWSKTGAAAFNLSKGDAIKYGAVYSNLLSGFSKDTSETMTNTEALLKASGVVASATGRSMTDVLERIRSGLLGNTESIEDLGINVNVAMIQSTNAFRKFANGKSWDQLDFQTQSQIRLFAILEQSTKKYGDSLADNTNTRMGLFVMQLKNIQLSLGQAFLPILNVVLPYLTAMATALSNVMSVVAQFSQALFGKADVQATADQANAVSGLGDAYSAAGKAAKGAVSGFDEVNTLSDSSGGGGSGGSPKAATSDTSGSSKLAEEVSQKVQEMANKVKAAFAEMSAFVTQHKEIIIAAIAGIAAGFATFAIAANWTVIMTALRTAFTGLAAAIGAISLPVLLAVAAVAALVAAFVYFYQTNEGFRGVVDGILRAIGEAAVWLWQSVLVPFGKFFGEVFVGYWNGVIAVATWLWKEVLVPLGDFMLWYKDNVLVPIGSVLADILGVAFQTVADIAKSFWQNVLVPLGEFFSGTFGPNVEALSAVFNTLWNDVLKPYASFMETVLKVGFTALKDVIVKLLEDVLKPLVTFVGDKMSKTFDTVFKAIGTLITNFQAILTTVMTFIKDTFTTDWSTAWESVKTTFSDVFGSLYDIVKVPLNKIIDAVNTVIEGMNKIHIDIPDIPGVPGRGTSFGINIPKIPKLAKGAITNGPMVAMIGDNPGGQEVVSPLDGLLDMIQSAVGSAVMAAAQFNNGGRDNRDIVINLEGVPLARVLAPFLQKENTRTGASMITTAGAATIVTT